MEGPSLKTEKGLAWLDGVLAEQSYVAGSHATQSDLQRHKELPSAPDRLKYPSLSRWWAHIRALSRGVAPWCVWPAAGEAPDAKKKEKAPRKEKTALVVDCAPVPCADRTQPSATPPGLGACAKNLRSSKDGAKNYYITTAINYANGYPHMGHAYEGIVSDVIARFWRTAGRDVFFMTGSDEHGQKIAQVAEAESIKPIQLCDRYVEGFKALNQRLCVSNDFYVRTTSEQHKEVAREMWRKCKANGDIYLDRYEGWYMVREEKFVTEQEATEWGFKDPGSGLPLEKKNEASYFFRLSKYKDPVLKMIEDNPDFIQPEQYRKEILERLRPLEMRDLSISRCTFSWGVPCPEDPVGGLEHVMYVWFDALTNYMSGVHGLDPKDPLAKYWPADVHVIGKDITWFHTVIWPAMLMSAKIPLPKAVFVHGFIAGPDGRKMSKSYGNIVNPHDSLDVLPNDTFRWYLCRESAFGDDLKYSDTGLRLMHNADLCDNLGNLVNRAVTLCGGSVPECDPKLVTLPFDLAALKKTTEAAFKVCKLSEAADAVVEACKATNGWITKLEPWKLKGDDQKPLVAASLRFLLEAVYAMAHFFAPFIPTAADAIFKKLNTPPRPIMDLSEKFASLKAGTPVTSGSVLFERLEVDSADMEKKPAAPTKDEKKPEAGAKAAPKGKAEAGAKPAKGTPAAADDPDQPLFSKLDVRVGRVVKAWNHPEADRLFVEEIDVGEAAPRQIVSGLREFYSQDEFEGKLILVVCNMKPSKLMKVESSGMVLCAKAAGKVELIGVPDGAKIGDRLLPKGMDVKWAPIAPEKLKKGKVWEAIAEELKTDKKKVACHAGVPLQTAAGLTFLAPTLPDSPIS